MCDSFWGPPSHIREQPRKALSWIGLSIPQDGNLMEKNHPFYQKSMEKNFLGLPHLMCFADFSNSMEKPCISQVMKSTIGWDLIEKITHTMGKVWVPIPQLLLIRLVLLDINGNQFPSLSTFRCVWSSFPMSREINGETHASPKLWSIP